MNRSWVFDSQHQKSLFKARSKFLERILQDVSPHVNLKTALDVGCGIGFFSDHLSGLGLKVIAVDARKENITEAKKRYPMIEFEVWNVEDPSIQELGTFDVVICFGLLYHLENPFQAIRNLYAVTHKILIVESMILPGKTPGVTLVDECQGEDQGLHHIAFIPSESCLIKMLYHAGFPEVYKTREFPEHKDFQKTFLHRRQRTTLVASKVKVRSSLLQLIPEPRQHTLETGLINASKMYQYARIAGFLRSDNKIWRLRNKFIPWFPLLGRLSFGGWWLVWNDVMGQHIYHHDDFEGGEQHFLSQFLTKGMTVVDIGAHQGLYTLLASKMVGPQGCVIAFEPSPRELQRLRWNIVINRCSNIQIEPVALSSSEGTAELFMCLGQETGCNSLRPPAVDEPVKKIQVYTVTLDAYIKKVGLDRIDFVKMDVEGAELDILKGANTVLSMLKPIIMCEFVDIRTKPWGYRSIEIYHFLQNLDYNWFSVTLNGKLCPCPVKKIQYHENLIAVPTEKLFNIESYII